MRKRVATFALACAMAITPVVGSLQMPVSVLAEEARVMNFPDVPRGMTGYNQIKFCYEKGWIDGTIEGNFNPNDNVKRGAFMKILAKSADIVTADYRGIQYFNDVPATHTFAPFIAWAKDNNITSGYANGNFGPGDYIHRDQVAVFLYKYFNVIAEKEGLKLPVIEGRENMTFSDEADIMSGGKNAVYALAKAGIINGKNGQFNPKENCTRAQAAIFIANFYNLIEKLREEKQEQQEEENIDTTLVDLGNGKIGRRVNLEQLKSMTHYDNYLDMNTSTASSNGKPVYGGYFTILDTATLREILTHNGPVDVNMERSGCDGYKYLLLDTDNLELALAALKKLNIQYKGKTINGLHLQYSRGYAGLNHNMKMMFAVAGDHYDGVATIDEGVTEGAIRVYVENPGIKDAVSFDNAVDADGKSYDTWANSTSIGWEPAKRNSDETFQKIILTYYRSAKINKDVYSPKYDQKFTVKATRYSSVTDKSTTLTNEKFTFKTDYEVKLELCKPSNYSYYMDKFFPYVSHPGSHYEAYKDTEETLPYWATLTATPERIDVYLSKGASFYYRWRFNDLFYTRCYNASNAFLGPEDRDLVSFPEDYAETFLATNGYPIVQELTQALGIEYHGTIPLRGVSYVYVHFDCDEKYVAGKNSYYRATYGLPIYTAGGANNPVTGGWESAAVDGRNKNFWYTAFVDYCVGNINNKCTMHKECAGYPLGGGTDGFGGTTKWVAPTSSSTNPGGYYEYKMPQIK